MMAGTRKKWAMRTVFAAAVLACAPPLAAQQSAEEWLERCRNRNNAGSRATHCEVRESTVAATGTFRADAAPNGGVSVQSWDRNEVLVRAKIQTHARSDSEARALAQEIAVSVRPGIAEVSGPRTENREGWSVSFEIWVPRQTNLDLHSTNGGLSVRGVSGRHDVRTTNGGISMSEVAGEIRGVTTNGGIVVRLTGASFSGAGLDLRTTNGAISLTVPQNFSAQLEASTVNGGLNIDFPVTVQGRIGRQVSAQIGSGGPSIRLRTTNGPIQIRRS